MLNNTGVTADIIHYFSDEELQFIITEKLEGSMIIDFSEHQSDILKLLNNFQAIDYTQANFLETLTFS